MIMKSLNTKVLTTYALFLAIMLIMAFVPGLGFIPTSVAAIMLIMAFVHRTGRNSDHDSRYNKAYNHKPNSF